MKKILLSVAMLLGAATAANAQLPFPLEVRAGVNYSNMTLGMEDMSSATLPGEKAGLNVGLYTEIALGSSDLFFKPGLVYSSLGYKSVDKQGTSYESTATTALNYIQLPLSIAKQYEAGRNSSIEFSVGIYLGYGVGGKTTTEMTESGVTETIEFDSFGKLDPNAPVQNSADMSNFDMGFKLGLGTYIDNKYYVGLSYDLGFVNTSHNTEYEMNPDFPKYKNIYNNRNLSVTVGYKF